MRRTSQTPLDEELFPLETLPVERELRDRVVQAAQVAMEHYEHRFAGLHANTFSRKVIRDIYDLKPKLDEYMLAPVNYILWLYVLGIREDSENQEFFARCVQEVHRLKNLPGTGNAVSISSLPITPRGQELIGRRSAELARPKLRTFNTLQTILTALAFLSMGRIGVSSSQALHEAFENIAPAMTWGFVSTETEGAGKYILSYSDVNPAYSFGLFAAVRARPLCLLLLNLVENSTPISTRATATLSRENMMARLLTFLAVSRKPDIDSCLKNSFVFSSRYVWKSDFST